MTAALPCGDALFGVACAWSDDTRIILPRRGGVGAASSNAERPVAAP